MTMRLSASQIEQIMELSYDQEAAAAVFKTAQTFYHNQNVEFQIRSKKFWDDLGEIHGLNLEDKAYTIKNVAGIHQIVEVDKE